MNTTTKNTLAAFLVAAIPATAYLSNRISSASDQAVPLPQDIIVSQGCTYFCGQVTCTVYYQQGDGKRQELGTYHRTVPGCIIDI